MIPIRMCRKFIDVMLELAANREEFIVEGGRVFSKHFDQGLNGSRAVDIHRYLYDGG